MNFLRIIIFGFLLGFFLNFELVASQEDIFGGVAFDRSTMKYENGRFVMENLPDEMSGEQNGEWIKEILTMFGISTSQSDVKYGDHSISFNMPCGCRCNSPE